jgi:hypothetical protein
MVVCTGRSGRVRVSTTLHNNGDTTGSLTGGSRQPFGAACTVAVLNGASTRRDATRTVRGCCMECDHAVLCTRKRPHRKLLACSSKSARLVRSACDHAQCPSHHGSVGRSGASATSVLCSIRGNRQLRSRLSLLSVQPSISASTAARSSVPQGLHS